MMIQNEISQQYYNREQEQLTKKIFEYKRINQSLKKKIKSRDKKLTYLFNYKDPFIKSNLQCQIDGQSMGKRDVCCTQPRKKQKQNVNLQHLSIFKEKYVENVENLHKIKLKLPVLERKSTHLDESEIVDTKPKVIKVAIQRLIPLKSEEVKKKFQKRFK